MSLPQRTSSPFITWLPNGKARGARSEAEAAHPVRKPGCAINAKLALLRVHMILCLTRDPDPETARSFRPTEACRLQGRSVRSSELA